MVNYDYRSRGLIIQNKMIDEQITKIYSQVIQACFILLEESSVTVTKWYKGIIIGNLLDAGILKMVQQVRLMMFSWNMVDYPMSFRSLSTWDIFGG